MSRKKGPKQAQRPPNICTYCGLPKKPLTDDHVFPQCLWTEVSNERSVMVKACKGCNNPSDETLLRSILQFLDMKLYDLALPHFKNPSGKADLRRLTRMAHWMPDGTARFFVYDAVTKQFRKIFMGLRRWLMRSDWFYLDECHFHLVKVDKTRIEGAEWTYEIRHLPLKVGGPNPWQPLDNKYNAEVERLPWKFRQFSFGCRSDDNGEMLIGMRYDREEHNMMLLWCYALNPTAKDPEPEVEGK